jgi:hypothetical protein
MKATTLTFALVAIAALSACGADAPQVESAKAQAERAEAAQHYGNSQYADLKPIGAKKAGDDKKDAQASDQKPK